MKIDKGLYKRASEETCTDYEPVEILDNDVQYRIDNESANCLIEDLLIEIEKQKEKYEDLKQDMEDNYKPISHSEMYGISDRDFI